MTNKYDSYESHASVLKDITIFSDKLDVSPQGHLMIDGCDVRDLINEYGSPLYVYAEKTFRENIRHFRKVWEANWPEPVNVMFAIKSNTHITLRTIAHQEGCGGDAYSENELERTFAGGADPKTIVVNGPWKEEACYRGAIERGVCVNLDAEEEIDVVSAIAKDMGKKAEVGIRVKPRVPWLEEKHFQSDQFPTMLETYTEETDNWKWGIGVEGCKRMVKRIAEDPNLEMTLYHCHLGRLSRDPEMYAEWNRGVAKVVAEVYKDTGFAPKFVDIGGGWPRDRDPEKNAPGDLKNPYTLNNYAKAVCEAMLEEFNAVGMPIPNLWLEPGRGLIGNAGMLLMTVGIIKTDPELKLDWTITDAHTFLSFTTGGIHNVSPVLLASGMDRPVTHESSVVGPACLPDHWDFETKLPDVKPGDIFAVLDVGMYAEQFAFNFNSRLNPASVLVKGGKAEIMTRRQTVDEMFGRQVLPERLKSE